MNSDNSARMKIRRLADLMKLRASFKRICWCALLNENMEESKHESAHGSTCSFVHKPRLHRQSGFCATAEDYGVQPDGHTSANTGEANGPSVGIGGRQDHLFCEYRLHRNRSPYERNDGLVQGEPSNNQART